MEKQTKNLGHVTAYGYAKSQGYTGTEEEYAQLMASYSSVAERAEAAAESAEESAREVKDVIPEVTSQDNGKVMMVENGEWGAGEVDVLPTVTTQDNGKVLGVVEGQWAKTEPEDGLPEVTSSDNGKVLSVVEGAWAPAEPTGGLPAVTSEDNGDILSVVDGAWAKSEPGYRVERSETEIIPEQSVTTESQGPINVGHITATVPYPLPDSVNVTFNGTNYENVPKHADATIGVEAYGDSAFSEYPFVIVLLPGSTDLLTQSAGTYTIAISGPSTTVTPNDNFKAAVNASGAPGYDVSVFTVFPSDGVTAVSQPLGYFSGIMYGVGWPDQSPDSIIVTVNGTDYKLPKYKGSILGGGVGYGAFDDDGLPVFSAYPYAAVFGSLQTTDGTFMAPEPGTYTVAVRYKAVTPTEDFKLAVNNSYMEAMETEKVTIPEQSVTTEVQEVQGISIVVASIADTDFTAPGTFPSTLHVVFDGTEYDLPRIDPDDYGYGAPWGDSGHDFTTYPLNIYFDGGTCHFYTETAGTYTIEATYTEATTAPTEKFKEAVKQSGGGALIVNDDGGSLDKTWQEIFDAYTSGTAVVIRRENYQESSSDTYQSSVTYYAIKYVGTNTEVYQGEETVTYSVVGSDHDIYESTSADDYPSANSGGAH